jgi:DNA-binding CsgD family transcriptional regulator
MRSTILHPGALLPAAAFAGYTLWLLAFPMKGVLLGEHAGRALLLAYLLPHAAMLAIAAFALPRKSLPGWCDIGVALTMAVTFVFPLLGGKHAVALLACTGLVSALAMIKAGALLRGSPEPALSAAAGLMLGNILLFLLLQAGLPPMALAWLLTGGLALLLRHCAPPGASSIRGLHLYLPFLFVYYVVSGLRYDILQAGFGPLSLPVGTDLASYVLAVLGAWALFRRDRDLCLALGILFGMLSLSFGFFSAGPASGLSMFCMQGSAGFVDLFLLGLLLQQDDYARAFGVGVCFLCLGIASGETLAGALQGLNAPVTVAGNGVLTVAVLLLYVAGGQGRGERAERAGPVPVQAQPVGGVPGGVAAEDDAALRLPAHIESRLSPRERGVLELVAGGCHYRDVAERMGISESSVKTYMRRVFEKTGVSGKKELMARVLSRGRAE